MNRILIFLNLTDRDGNLSITNIAVIIMISKIALMSSLGMADVSALIMALLNYSHKRFESNRAIANPSIDLSPINEAIKEINLKLDTTTQTASDAKDKADKLSLANGLTKMR